MAKELADREERRQQIYSRICKQVRQNQVREDIATSWGDPQVGFADAHHPYIQRLKEIISQDHGQPWEILPEARIVVAYYLPFTRELAKTNAGNPELASPEWARAYEETNRMIGEINEDLVTMLAGEGYHAAIPPQSKTFHRDTLISDWSQRHFAYAAGLGTFGVNNMLITKTGCCGRYSTVVTDLDILPDEPLQEELCLYKKKGICGVCVKHCPSGALLIDGFDRQQCSRWLHKSAQAYQSFGSSYGGGTGSEVCGKCVTQSPCAFWKV